MPEVDAARVNCTVYSALTCNASGRSSEHSTGHLFPCTRLLHKAPQYRNETVNLFACEFLLRTGLFLHDAFALEDAADAGYVATGVPCDLCRPHATLEMHVAYHALFINGHACRNRHGEQTNAT